MTQFQKTASPHKAEGYKPSAFTYAWAFWVTFFLIIEGVALARRNPDDTFSEFWWAVFQVRRKVPLQVRITLVALQLAFATWLTGHLVFGKWSF